MPWPPEARQVDEMVDCYLEWRQSATAVATAYQQWFHAPRAEERQRYSAYTASLDQEESAAITYELAVADVEQWLERSRRPQTRTRLINPEPRSSTQRTGEGQPR